MATNETMVKYSEAFDQSMAMVEMLVDVLQEHRVKFSKVENINNYGFVGDLEHVNDILDNALDFLNNVTIKEEGK